MNATWIRRRTAAPIGKREGGFSLVELLVAMSLFLVLTGVVLSAVISMSRGLDKAQETSNISAEARVAMERIAREARQADKLTNPLLRSMTLNVDFNGSGSTTDGTPADPEVVTYAYVQSPTPACPTGKCILMTAQANNGAETQDLLAGRVKDLTFTYTSANWVKDVDGDGTVTLAEAGADGVDRVHIHLEVVRDGTTDTETFDTSVTLRNRSQT